MAPISTAIVDFDEAMHRGTMYRDFEAHAREEACNLLKRRLSNMANMDPKKCPMPSQDPNVRNKNFKEVALGYTAEMACERSQALPAVQKARVPHRLPC